MHFLFLKNKYKKPVINKKKTAVSDIEFFSGPFVKRMINAFNSDFIKVLSKSNFLFGFLRTFSRSE